MIGRVVEGLVALGVLASAALLAVMLAAPFLPQLAAAPSAPGPTPSQLAPPVGSAGPGDAEEALAPTGTFLLRGTLGFSSTCLGLVLDAASYPTGLGASGAATVLAWESPIADGANPAACSSRRGDLRREEAVVQPVHEDDDPDRSLVGYAVRFHLPRPPGGEADMEIVILAAQSTRDTIQALDMTTSGSGLVFERVAEIDPTLAPSPSPTALTWPDGLFLLRGPFDAEGPCIVLEIAPPPAPAGPDDMGSASIRWWEPASRDAGDPAACLSRIGEVGEAPAEIGTVRNEGDPSRAGISYVIRFTLPAPDGAGPREVLLEVPVDQVTPDQLIATLVGSDGGRAFVFDRVDTIDPPLVPAP